MIEKLLSRAAYVYLVRLAQYATGIKPHYKAQYGLYLLGPRWFILRNLRLWWDGWTCTRCGDRRQLQVHHTSYRNKDRGCGVGEFLDLRTLCDDCHDRVHGIK